jgi:predicted HAD superfamily hydrolase
MTGESLMGVMKAVYNNSSHLKMEDVKFIEGVREVEFVVNEEDERWRRICIDGEIVIVEQSAVVSVRICDGVQVGGEALQVSVTSCSQSQ